MCNSTATTREHVPPLSFFPIRKRDKLITVPSCETHNNGNSQDIEYIRNIINVSIDINEIGLLFFNDKTKRSFERSWKLTKTTFQNLFPVELNGITTMGFTYSIERFNKVFNAIGCGLYFHDFNENFQGKWVIVNVNAYLNSKHIGNPSDEAVEILLKSIRYNEMNEMPTESPDVFRYFQLFVENIRIYLLVFYEGFEVVLASREAI